LVLGKKRVDFVVEDVMVEIKARSALEDVDKVQTLSYLKASGYPIGLLINFGGPKIEVVRLANTKPRRRPDAPDRPEARRSADHPPPSAPS
jgi:hypothetical protein